MKKLNKKSLLSNLDSTFIQANIIIVVLLMLTPFIYYQVFIESQYGMLVKYIEANDSMTAKDVVLYAHEHGYDVAAGNLESIDVQGNSCTVKNAKSQRANIQSSRKVHVAFDGGCDDVVISLNYVLLHDFTNFYFLITIVMTMVVIIGNTWNFHKTKEKIRIAFTNVNKEIEEIKLTASNDNYSKKESSFLEFQQVIDDIDELNTQINQYITERHTLVSTLNHELKSPINKVNSLIQAYNMQVPGYDDANEMVKVIEEELETLINIVNFSLDVFVKTNIKEEKEMNINDLIFEILMRREEVFEVRGLTYNYLENDQVVLINDIRVIELVLSNLIENISKYAKENSEFKVEVNKDEIVFSNQISNERNVGTQQELKLSMQLIKSLGYDLEYAEHDDFVVKIILK